MAAASRQHDSPDRCLACTAWFAFAAIDAVFELEKSFLSVRVHVIGNRGASSGDRFTQYFPHRMVKLGQFLARDRGGAAAWTDSGAKEGLIGINIAYAAHQLLV